MGLSILVVLKNKDRGKPLDGSGVALEATTLDPTIRTGADQEIVHLLNHVSLLEMITPWILPLLSTRLQTTKNAKNTERQADVSNVGNKVILFVIVLTKRHAFILFKLKTMRNQPLPKLLPHLCLSLHK